MVDRTEPDLEALTAATFEPIRVRRASGARVRLVIAAWVFGLVGIAGVAVVGRLTETDLPSAPLVAMAPTPLAVESPASSLGARSDAPGPAPSGLIVLTSPAEGDPTITAAEIIVQGFLQAEAASLRVSLETDWYPVQEATILPTDRHPRFLVRFDMPDPRTGEPMVVRVIALDRDGEWLANVQRPFRLGPIERPTLGDDGLVGGIVFSDG